MSETKSEELIIKEFKTKKLRQLIAVVPMLLAFFLLMGMDNPELNYLNLSENIAGPIAIIIIIISLVFALFNWRCPACNKYLGKGFSPKFCSKCGTRLQ